MQVGKQIGCGKVTREPEVALDKLEDMRKEPVETIKKLKVKENSKTKRTNDVPNLQRKAPKNGKRTPTSNPGKAVKQVRQKDKIVRCREVSRKGEQGLREKS